VTYKAILAKLLDHFHVPLDLIPKMTRRQVFDLYFFPRDSEGNLLDEDDEDEAETGPAVPMTMEQELADLDQIARMFNVPVADVERTRAEIRKRYEKQ